MSRAPRLTWGALVLLAISGFLNYFDRANLSVGAAQVQSELHLTSYQLGLLLSAFFWSYALMQLFLLAGWLADRFNVCWVLAVGFFLWSGATAVTGATRTFAMMFALRLVLGIGESIAYPSYSRILANYFPEHHRGMANAMIDAGTKLGPAMGTLIGGLLMAIYGWRAFFVVLGAGSLIWLIPWILWMPRGEGAETHHAAQAMPSAGQILRHRAAIFSALGLFCSNYFWYFLLTWLPYYLHSARHFTFGRMATTAASAYFLIALSTMIAGYLSDRFIARGASVNRVRKTCAGVGLTFSTIILPVAIVQDAGTATVFLMLACFSFGIYTANVFAITQTLAGPRAAGKWTSLQNGFANLAGVTAPWLTGFIVQQTGEYFWAFVVAAAVVLTGAAIFIFCIGRLEPVQWARPTGVAFPEVLDA
jgi:ACS family D-galactonate transporter-like MFS transporter